MRNILKKTIALALCAALCVSCLGLVSAETENEKDETVYVLAGSDGSVETIIVSDWLKNASGAETLADESTLTDIQTVKGDAVFTSDGTALAWETSGDDVYYQGTSNQELPVTVQVTYTLDGETVEPQELAGKSGHVVIRFDYQNNEYEMKEISGQQEKIYVPFAAITGLVLDNDRFRNVEVTNGKLINDGDRTAVVGLALPGLQESLALDGTTLTLPDYVEVAADVTDFQMSMTLTLISSQPFSALSEDTSLDSADDLTAAASDLTGGLAQLTDGAGELADGLDTLLEKTGELADGVQQLAEGAQSLYDGTAQVRSGAEQLSSGAQELSTGLNTLTANSEALNSAADQVFAAILATATEQLEAAGLEVPDLTAENYSETLTEVLASLDASAIYRQALSQVTAAVEANRDAITEQVTAAVREQVTAQVTEAVRTQVAAQVIPAALNMSQEDYEAAVAAGQVSAEQQAAVTAAIDAQMESETVQATLTAALDAQMETQDVQTFISQNVEQQVENLISENMQSDTVQSQLTAAEEGYQTIAQLQTSLDSAAAFCTGLKTYTAGVDSAASGAEQLSTGASRLYTGAEELTEGTLELRDGAAQLREAMPDLTDGVTQLRDGAQALSDGIQEFIDEIDAKLSDLTDGDLESLAARLTAVIQAAQNYEVFTALPDTMTGQVKFLYRTDEIQ